LNWRQQRGAIDAGSAANHDIQLMTARLERPAPRPAEAPPVRHHWSDWVGLVGYTALAVSLWRRAPEFGLAVIPAFSAELLVAASFLVRRPATRRVPGWLPRAVAYTHTFLPMVFLELASRYRPLWLAGSHSHLVAEAGAAIWLAGALLALWPLWQLRRAFSVEPQARELVTSGPYRFARHPIYAAYVLVNCGLWLRHPTLPFGTVLVFWFALLLIRIRYEERVLESAFPEYATYRVHVGALGPRLG
jgi:protein-S-isoprenylcysteine O-methyltransferase Ste14